jgi:hypothetical protein
VQAFATVGLQMPMLLHVPAWPALSFGHGAVVLHACVQTWKPDCSNK